MTPPPPALHGETCSLPQLNMNNSCQVNGKSPPELLWRLVLSKTLNHARRLHA